MLSAAAARSRRRLGRTRLSRGDLLSGLAGVSGLVGSTLHRAAVDFEALDADCPVLDPERLAAAGPGDARAWVIAPNDARTPMDFVTSMLRERFARPEVKAQHLMYRVHFLGAATFAELPFDEAHAVAEPVTQAARRDGHPFRLLLRRAAG